jgi:hypothetical protein
MQVRRALVPPGGDVVPVVPATTWLLAVGWRRHGTIRTREIP